MGTVTSVADDVVEIRTDAGAVIPLWFLPSAPPPSMIRQLLCYR
jgi:hypothetical protein